MSNDVQGRLVEPIAVRIPEACRMIGIGRSKLYELITSGDIETIKIGASRLVLVASLTKFVDEKRGTRSLKAALWATPSAG
ncbi:helix-turn-helix domain-containing protein [Sphingomonas sp. RT2P30]|uniref:helix-turn-helix domain-containing protein n=1 Tax=Parasphingomonas halimpatiens TaxID=3096162 RepID=UPI002FCB5BB8